MAKLLILVLFCIFAAEPYSANMVQQPNAAVLCKLYSAGKQENVNRTDFQSQDCSFKDLNTIPHSFQNETLRLDLNNNKLSNITGSPFKELYLLQILDLGFNSISNMTVGAFAGLSQLRELSFAYNKITAIPDQIFLELGNLKVLDLRLNLLHTIPSKAVAPLLSLQLLVLVGNYFTSFTLGKEFQNLTSLSTLTIANAKPSLQVNITKETFQYWNPAPKDTVYLFVSWQSLNISVSSVGAVTNMNKLSLAGQPLDQFESTDCPMETLTICTSCSQGSGSTLAPLQYLAKWNSTLRTLAITGYIESIQSPVFSWTPFLQNLILNNMYIKSLSDDAFDGLERLEALVLSYNNLGEVPSHAFGVFTKHATLRHLDLSYNGMTGFIPANAFAALPFLTSLNMADNKFTALEDWTEVLVNLQYLNLTNTYITILPTKNFPSLIMLLLGVTEHKLAYPFRIKEPLCNLANLLQKVTLTNFPVVDKILGRLIGSECLHLIELDISGFFLVTEILSIKQSNISLPNLIVLEMARNYIESIQQMLFLKVPKLEELDLSYNEIQRLQISNVPFLNQLKYLNLEGNKLISLSGLKSFVHLEALNAARNQITTVPDFLFKPVQSALVLLDLGGNPFDCTCNIMHFKKWMTEDNITFLVPTDLYLCASPDNVKGRMISTIALDCKSRLFIYLGAGIACGSLIVTVIFFAVRYRWHIRYKLFLLLHRRRILNYADIDQEQIVNDGEDVNHPLYDAYIAYADESTADERWVINVLGPNLEEGPDQFQLFIKGRDSIPGSSILDSIADNIQQSHKTILVLSPDFVNSEWCYFEMQMARMQLFNDNRNVPILIMLKNIPDKKLTLALRQLLSKQDYFKWPADNVGQNLFWRRLREEIKKPVHVDRRYDI